jgi:hypothetical protein
MSERERYIPPEARQESEGEKKPQKQALSSETVANIRYGPPESSTRPKTIVQAEATGDRTHWRTPDGNLITPEKEEIYRSSETLPEKEPGYGPKASHRDDPTKAGNDDTGNVGTDAPATDTVGAEEDI